MLQKQHYLAKHQGQCPVYFAEMDSREASKKWYESLSSPEITTHLFSEAEDQTNSWISALPVLNATIPGESSIPSDAIVVYKVRLFILCCASDAFRCALAGVLLPTGYWQHGLMPKVWKPFHRHSSENLERRQGA